jgi:hypothetical protein
MTRHEAGPPVSDRRSCRVAARERAVRAAPPTPDVRYLARVPTMQLAVLNADARRDLEWSPMFPSSREGLREAFATWQPPRPATEWRHGGVPWSQ